MFQRKDYPSFLDNDATTMHRLLQRIRNLAFLLKFMQWKEVLHRLRSRIYSEAVYHGLINVLSNAPTEVSSAIPVHLRQLHDGDIAALFDVKIPHLSEVGITERIYRLLLIHGGIRSCYVAVTPEGNPCSALWLIPATENKKLRDHANGIFPPLADDEMLLEGLYTLETYRNKHIMAYCIVQILEKAKETGAKKVLSFVHSGNIQSLRSLQRAGFIEHTIKREKWFLFFRTITIEPIPGRNVPAEIFSRIA